MTLKHFFLMPLLLTVLAANPVSPQSVRAAERPSPVRTKTAKPVEQGGEAAAVENPADKPVETGLPELYDGQLMNPGHESEKQMETLLRQQYIDWVLGWKLPDTGKPVLQSVMAVRLKKLRYDLQRCAEKSSRYRHPKARERSRVSFIQVDNRCAINRVRKALAPPDS
jgi:hypothetical protein